MQKIIILTIRRRTPSFCHKNGKSHKRIHCFSWRAGGAGRSLRKDQSWCTLQILYLNGLLLFSEIVLTLTFLLLKVSLAIQSKQFVVKPNTFQFPFLKFNTNFTALHCSHYIGKEMPTILLLCSSLLIDTDHFQDKNIWAYEGS